MPNRDVSGFQPLYSENGKRDSKRRYFNPQTNESMSRRAYEQALQGKSFESKAKERREQGTILTPGQSQYNRNLETYAKQSGKTISKVRRDPEFIKLNKMLKTEFSKRGRAIRKGQSYSNDDLIAELLRRVGRKRMDDYTSLGATPDLT